MVVKVGDILFHYGYCAQKSEENPNFLSSCKSANTLYMNNNALSCSAFFILFQSNVLSTNIFFSFFFIFFVYNNLIMFLEKRARGERRIGFLIQVLLFTTPSSCPSPSCLLIPEYEQERGPDILGNLGLIWFYISYPRFYSHFIEGQSTRSLPCTRSQQ